MRIFQDTVFMHRNLSRGGTYPLDSFAVTFSYAHSSHAIFPSCARNIYLFQDPSARFSTWTCLKNTWAVIFARLREEPVCVVRASGPDAAVSRDTESSPPTPKGEALSRQCFFLKNLETSPLLQRNYFVAIWSAGLLTSESILMFCGDWMDTDKAIKSSERH